MFKELRKLMFLSKSTTIPQKLSVFTNKLTHIEAASVDEIEELLSDAMKLESFILSYKGKMSDYLHLYYFNTISHLKEDLINLYENKTKEVLSSQDVIENEESIINIKKTCQKYNDTKLKDVKKRRKKSKKVRKPKEKRRALPKVRPARKKIGKSLKMKAERKLEKLNIRVMNTFNNLNKKNTSLSKNNSKKSRTSLKDRINLVSNKISNSIFVRKNDSKKSKPSLKDKISLVSDKISNSNFVSTKLKPVIIASMLFVGISAGFNSSSKEVETDSLITNNTNDIVNDYDENVQFTFKSDTELMVENLISNQSVQIEDEKIEVTYNTVSSGDIQNLFVEANNTYQEVEEMVEVIEEEQNIEIQDLVENNIVIEEEINDQNDITLQIGEEISVIEGSCSYTNMYDAYFNENGLNPSYKDEEVVRKIKTIIVSNGEQLKNVSSNEQLETYFENGYEIIGCSVTNQYSVNDSVEGYYRFDSIKVNEYQKVLK